MSENEIITQVLTACLLGVAPFVVYFVYKYQKKKKAESSKKFTEDIVQIIRSSKAGDESAEFETHSEETSVERYVYSDDDCVYEKHNSIKKTKKTRSASQDVLLFFAGLVAVVTVYHILKRRR